MTLTEQISDMKRQRIPPMLLRSFDWYKALDDEQRYLVEERVSIMCDNGPCTHAAYVCARNDLERYNAEVSEPGDRPAANATGATPPDSLH